MAYLKRGPWVDGGQIDGADLTAMDDAIAAAQHTAHLDLGSVSGTVLIDAATYGSVALTLTGPATLAISGLSPAGSVGYLDVFVNTNGFALTWPTGTVWPGSAPVLQGMPDLVRLIGVGPTVFGRLLSRYRYNEASLPAVGGALMGGFYVGIMDTIKTPPVSGDSSNRRIRYALILSPRSMQFQTNVRTSVPDFSWQTSDWDGEYESRGSGLIAGLPMTADGGSKWYIPAPLELALIYWAFKPANVQNAVPSGGAVYGKNDYADPPRPEFTASVPAQTPVTAFRQGGAQYVGTTGSNVMGVGTSYGYNSYGAVTMMAFLSTDVNASGGATGGVVTNLNFVSDSFCVWRPMRRLILAEQF